MSYTPTEWTTGDIITAEKLNHIENGVESANSSSGGLYIVQSDEYQFPLCTLGDIRTAITNGKFPIRFHSDTNDERGQYDPMEMFTDNGLDEASFIRFNSTQYQSTSGADSATWEAYD